MNRTPFAFISYSRKDVAVAADLHQRIEKYVYPHNEVAEDNRPEDDERVRPIYFDLTDLSAQNRNFSDELRENLALSRYLIVICSPHAAQSPFVKDEIEHFLTTHNGATGLVIPVYIDNVFSGMHPAIDGILATRNCPIYVTGKGDAGHLGRKYCFYHVLEFLLKVDFDKLFNRYEAYKRRKNRLRITLLATFLTLLLAALSFGWYKQYRATQTEHELAMTEHDLAQFEKETFPFSLVIGYVDNFLSPTLRALQDSLAPRKPHIFVIMPSNYKRLDEQTRKEHFRAWQARLKQDFGFDGFITHEVKIKSRRRASSIVQMRLTKVNAPVFHDFATTVKAIQSVVDYKFDASRHLVQIDTTKMSRDVMVREYSDQFIRQAKQRIGADSVYVHFVYAPEQMLRELQRLQAHK